MDQRRNNGEVALHIAARKGPLRAIWILLLSKATHDVLDERYFTPEYAASRAGRKESATLLANWPLARQRYLDSEFVQEWMHFLRDPDANLESNLRASEVLARIRIEQHEESTAVRTRGGHTLIDETITGPVLTAEDRERARLTEFPARMPDVATASNGDGKAQKSESCGLGSVRSNAREDRTRGDGVVSSSRQKNLLGMGIDQFLARARDENSWSCSGRTTNGMWRCSHKMPGASVEASEDRRPRPVDDGKTLAVTVEERPTGLRSIAINGRQRRRAAALEVAKDGGERSRHGQAAR